MLSLGKTKIETAQKLSFTILFSFLIFGLCILLSALYFLFFQYTQTSDRIAEYITRVLEREEKSGHVIVNGELERAHA